VRIVFDDGHDTGLDSWDLICTSAPPRRKLRVIMKHWPARAAG
jgi:DUF971 family protein